MGDPMAGTVLHCTEDDRDTIQIHERYEKLGVWIEVNAASRLRADRITVCLSRADAHILLGELQEALATK